MKKPLVLVIDDEKIIHNTMRKALKGSGMQLAFAENGREALKIMKKKSTPSLIFLDLCMPVMDGLAFLDHSSKFDITQTTRMVPCIDNNCAFFDPVPLDEFRYAHCADQDIRPAHDLR